MEKLVRDLIPELMTKAGIVPSVRVLEQIERQEWLLKKLREETAELIETPNLEECADVIEVVMSIAQELGYSLEQLLQAAEAKRAEKGGFSSGLVINITK